MSQHSSSPPSLHTRQNSMWSSSSSPAASSSSSSSSLASHWIPSFSCRGGGVHAHLVKASTPSQFILCSRLGSFVVVVFLRDNIRPLLQCLFVVLTYWDGESKRLPDHSFVVC